MKIERELELEEEESKVKKMNSLKDEFSTPIEKKEEKEDPYLLLGYGMIAYFRLLIYLTISFLLFTLLSIPALVIYSSYDGLSWLGNYSKTKYSLGNMGFTGYYCDSTYYGL